MSILSDTPGDVIELILNLTLDIKTKNLNFDDLLSLLKKWHNKKLARELILEFLNNIEVMTRDELSDCRWFIVDLIEIDEVGLAKKFYDLLIYSHRNFIGDVDELKNDLWLIYKSCYGNNSEKMLERLFKIVNHFDFYYFVDNYYMRELSAPHIWSSLVNYIIEYTKNPTILILYSERMKNRVDICDTVYFSNAKEHTKYYTEEQRKNICMSYGNYIMKNYFKPIKKEINFSFNKKQI